MACIQLNTYLKRLTMSSSDPQLGYEPLFDGSRVQICHNFEYQDLIRHEFKLNIVTVIAKK
jgi:hypothetical protein